MGDQGDTKAGCEARTVTGLGKPDCFACPALAAALRRSKELRRKWLCTILSLGGVIVVQLLYLVITRPG